MMARKTKEKPSNCDIFSLYKKEKIIVISDDENREVKILFVKPTQGQRQEVLEIYIEKLDNIKKELQKKDERTGYYTQAINSLTKSQLIDGIVSYEVAQRSELVDLYPDEEGKKLSEKSRKEKEKKLIVDWEKERTEELKKETLLELKKVLKEKTIEGLSLVESGKFFDYMTLQAMCLNPSTREPIFKNYNDLENVLDKRILEQLTDELKEFRRSETMQQVREDSENPDFLAPGES